MKKYTNFEDEMDKYPSTPDWPLIIGTGFMVGFGIIMLLSII